MAAIPFINGAAPPPSRKFTERPEVSPVLVDAKPPVKYGARFTAVLFTVPLARIPGTLMLNVFGVSAAVHILLAPVLVLTISLVLRLDK